MSLAIAEIALHVCLPTENIKRQFAMTNWVKYTNDNIVSEIDYVLESNEYGGGDSLDYWDMLDKVERVKIHNGYGIVWRALVPYIEEYLFHPDERMHEGDENLLRFFRTWIFRHPSSVSELLEGHDLLELVETFAKYSTKDDQRDRLFLCLMRSYCLTSESIDWHDLYERTKFELVNGVKDYNWTRMTMLSMLMGIVMIMKQCERDYVMEKMLLLYENNWSFFGGCYSILLGKVVGSGYHHLNAVVGQFAGGHMKDTAWAARELIDYCRKPLRNNMTQNSWAKLCGLGKRILDAIDNVEQDYTLQPLFKILFPKTECDSYANAAPRRTAAEYNRLLEEKEHKIAERDRMIEDWKSKAVSLEKQVKELTEKMRKALVEEQISIELLKEAILSYQSGIARTLFTRLDWVLEGKNHAWNSHRDELKQTIREKEREESTPKVTHVTADAYYESGATHADHRNTIALEAKGSADVGKLIGMKKENN